MKGKLNRLKPTELSTLDFKDLKLLVKKDLELLQNEGETGSNFYLCTEFNVKDKKSVPVLVIGELKGEWKQYIKEQVKPQHKNTAFGTCKISADGKTLDLEINKGKAKPKAIEKALTKGSEKIIPSTIDFINFKENIIPDEEESQENANDWEKTGMKKNFNEIQNFETIEAKRGFFSKMFKKDKSGYLDSAQRKEIIGKTNEITAQLKLFKSNTENRTSLLKEILNNIQQLEVLHNQIITSAGYTNEYKGDEKIYKVVLSYIGEIKNKLKAEFDTVLKRLSAGYFADNIDKIVSEFSKLKKEYSDIKNLISTNKTVTDVTRITDQMDDLKELSETINQWHQKNPSHLYMNQKTNESKDSELISNDYKSKITELGKILTEISNMESDYKKILPDLRKNNVKAMLKRLTDASPEEKEKLKKDELFLWELSRIMPVAQINNANKLLGLPPVKEVRANDTPLSADIVDVSNDAEMQKLFMDFEKFTKFEVATDHQKDPLLSKTITLADGTQLLPENILSGNIVVLNQVQEFEVISEFKNGDVKIEYNGKIYYYKKSLANSVKENTLVYQKKTDELFKTDPERSHVIQGGLGDCYLLAALSSLVSKDPAAIKDMMLDKGDTVTVRLFEVHVDKNNKKTFKAKYINVDKSVPIKNNKDQFARDYLWVQMIEKAYAAGRFSGNYEEKSDDKDLVDEGTFQKIEGGSVAYANEVLTGCESKTVSMFNFYETNLLKDFAQVSFLKNKKGEDFKNNKASYKALPWGTKEIELFKIKKPNYKKAISYNILNKNEDNVKKWANYILFANISQLFKREYKRDYHGEITLEDFELFFNGQMYNENHELNNNLSVLDSQVTASMIQWLKNENLYPGKKGSGIYSKLQTELFNDIKTALDSKKIVGLGSKEKVGYSTTGSGHSAGEEISAGLVGNHAYSVLETKEENGLKKLLLRNPWGSTVREYVKVVDRKNELNNNNSPKIDNIYKEITGNKLNAFKDIIILLDDFIKRIKLKQKNLLKLIKDENWKKCILIMPSIKNYEKDRSKLVNGSDEEKLNLAKTGVAFYKLGLCIIELKDNHQALFNDQSLELDKIYSSFMNEMSNDFVKNVKVFSKNESELDELKKYKDDELVPVERENLGASGEFWLEIDDITRRFSDVYIG